MAWARPKYVRTRLTLWYVFVLGVSLVVSAAGASLLLFWQMRAQLKRQAVQDLETVEGLLFFGPDRTLHFNEQYHNHPESKLVQDRYLEVLSPDGAILYRNDRLANGTMDGAPF